MENVSGKILEQDPPRKESKPDFWKVIACVIAAALVVIAAGVCACAYQLGELDRGIYISGSVDIDEMPRAALNVKHVSY